MDLFDLILIAVALSMDAFAVAVCKGLTMHRFKAAHAVTVGLYFGIAQAAMPVAGYFLGMSFEEKIKKYDHWIAFILLSLIGLKMIAEVIKSRRECAVCEKDAGSCDTGVGFRQMLPLAVATSIDALAVGVSFAFLGVDIFPAASFIGATTFVLSFAGVGIGGFFGSRFQRTAQLSGGVILILLGVKILAGHLGAG